MNVRAALFVLSVVSAGSQVPSRGTEAVRRIEPVVAGYGCEACADIFVPAGDYSVASWYTDGGSCMSGFSCISCYAAGGYCMQQGGNISGSYATVYAWYQANSCSAYSCDGGGKTGGGELEEALALPTAQQAVALRTIITREASIKFNEARSVIQVHGCGDRVVAQFAVSPPVARALEVASATLRVP